MRDKTYHAYLDSHERQLVIHSLVELKNRLIQESRYTDCVDELIFKVVNAPVKKMKIEHIQDISHIAAYSYFPKSKRLFFFLFFFFT